MLNDYLKVTFAAFAHDIGKLLQRSEAGSTNSQWINQQDKLAFCPLDRLSHKPTHIHAAYTAQFLRRLNVEEDVIHLSALHHIHTRKEFEERLGRVDDALARYHTYICQADGFSAGLDREEDDDESYSSRDDWRMMSKVMMQSLAPTLFEQQQAKRYGFPIGVYPDAGVNMTLVELVEGNYERQLERYTKLVDQLVTACQGLKPTESLRDFQTFVGIVERFTNYVPAATNVASPDVSLFEHLKTTAAIAGSYLLHQAYENDNQLKARMKTAVKNVELQVVELAIEGAEEFVFELLHTSELATALTKTLRGRSVYARLLPEVIGQFVTDQLNVSAVHLIYVSPTKVRLLLPNEEQFNQQLKAVVQQVKEELVKLHGELVTLHMVSETFGRATKFSDVMDRLYKKRVRVKYCPSVSAIKQQGTHFFIQRVGQVALCPNCHIPIESHCSRCSQYEQLGAAMVKENGWLIYRREATDTATITFGRLGSIEVASTPDREALNWDYYNRVVPYPFKAINLTAPLADGDLVPLDVLAEQGKGDDKLAIVKVQLKQYSTIVEIGLTREQRSISRVLTLQRQFETFIFHQAQRILQARRMYSVFSTDDSLVFVGAWSEALEAAAALTEQFKQFVHNDELHFVTTHVLVPKKFPLHRAHEMMVERMTKLLQSQQELAAFEYQFTWNEWQRLMEMAGQIRTQLQQGYVSVQLLYRLLQTSQQAERFGQGNEAYYLLFPQLSYSLVRNIKHQPTLAWWKQRLLSLDERSNQLLHIQYPVQVILRELR